MSNISASNQVRGIVPSKSSNIHLRRSQNYADLQNELIRIRAVLTHETMMSQLITTKPEIFPDPLDQAASEHENDIALSMKLLAFAKLRRIERALTSLQTRSYGICSHCAQAIPSARLNVQPDSLYCVPCLTVIEQQPSRN
jgi:RNA polymerase-binding transcription factor DksA